MNQKTILTLVVTTLAVSVIPISVAAQKVQTQNKNLPNARVITISGQVTQLLDDEFILNNGTEEIIIEAEPRWGQAMNLSVGEQVTVVGRYDDNEFEAHSITLANGEMIQIHDD